MNQYNNAANQPQMVLREAGNLDLCRCADASEEHGRLNPGEKIKVAGKKRQFTGLNLLVSPACPVGQASERSFFSFELALNCFDDGVKEKRFVD